ncbi:MAG: ATP-binding protein [Desulfovibrionaceae bacterium]|nr:ATP-binding protein [Desulfovibrionaceae bacterium]
MSAGKYARLRVTIIATTLCFAILPILAVGVAIPTRFTDLYHEKTLREVENVAVGRARALDVFLDERVAQVKSIADMHSFKEITASGRLGAVLKILKTHSRSYVDFGIIDMEGTHVVYAGPYDVHSANYKNETWFAEVRRKGVFVSDVFLGFRNFPHIIIAVLREEGDTTWILRATIDSAVLDSIALGGRPGARGDSFVVNREGALQTDSRTVGVMMAKTAVAWSDRGAVDEEELAGRRMLLAKIPLTRVPWMLVVAEDPSEHRALLDGARTLAVGVVALALAAVSCGAWLTTQVIIKRLVAAEKEKAACDAGLLQASKMAALGKMAAGVAHEINNPLMLIREHAGWVKDLLEDENPEQIAGYEEMKQAAVKIEQNVDRASGITHRLLGFARRVDPTSESMPLNPIVEQGIGFLQNEAAHRGIALERAFTTDELFVSTDVGQLQQVVLNIIDNAIDAAGKGGIVHISTAGEGMYGVIRVRDNGPGIPPDRLHQIFDPFFTTKRPGEGTGLGLSICYSIMEGLGGDIGAANHPEGGAEFTIRLPASRGAGGSM